ncbi:hypothetical protein DIPPA_12775 [Diplonema papillatum]|nr:hypothetical protein DIPPA_12775 [Diplonema papillatum]
MWFHGSMAFGGGGILVSNKGGRTWKDFWHGGLMTAAKTWLLSGRCSHAGGDGAVCRCLRAAYGRDDMLTNWKGLHQFDITGTAEMLDLVRDTCPVCPSVCHSFYLRFSAQLDGPLRTPTRRSFTDPDCLAGRFLAVFSTYTDLKQVFRNFPGCGAGC